MAEEKELFIIDVLPICNKVCDKWEMFAVATQAVFDHLAARDGVMSESGEVVGRRLMVELGEVSVVGEFNRHLLDLLILHLGKLEE
jgi:hypothetical protein